MAKSRQPALVAETARGHCVGYLLLAAVRFFLEDDRVDVQSLGDLLVEVQDGGKAGQRWLAGELNRSGRFGEQFAAALRNSYSVWFTSDDRAALREQLTRVASHAIILAAGPASRLAPGRDMDPSAAAERLKKFWLKKGSAEALTQSQALLRRWLAAPVAIESFVASDAVLTIGGPKWPDRLVTAFQGRGRKPDQEDEGKLPPVPAPRTVQEAFSLLEARFPNAELPEHKAVVLLRSEITRLRNLADQQPTARRLPSAAVARADSLSAEDVSRLASLPDREFFRQFGKLKTSIPTPQLKSLLSAFLEKQAGRDFSEIANNDARLERKKRFASQIRQCAQFVHCKFRHTVSGEVGNLTFGKTGTSASGQFKLYRKESGRKIMLLTSSNFPSLSLFSA